MPLFRRVLFIVLTLFIAGVLLATGAVLALIIAIALGAYFVWLKIKGRRFMDKTQRRSAASKTVIIDADYEIVDDNERHKN